MGMFDGQAVLITGGGSGLGRGLVDAFIAEGASVGVLERSADKVTALRAAMKGEPVEVVQGDVRDTSVNEEAVESTVKRFGQLDALVQCTGIADFSPALNRIPASDLDSAFHDIMDINVLGSIKSAQAAIPFLKKSRGAIVFTLSTSGILVGTPHSLYNISKAALAHVVRQYAYELAPHIRVNAVIPAAIKGSDMRGPASLGQADIKLDEVFGDIEPLLEKSTLLGIYPTPADYAPIYLLLAHRIMARIVTGSLVAWDTGILTAGSGMGMAEFLREGDDS